MLGWLWARRPPHQRNSTAIRTQRKREGPDRLGVEVGQQDDLEQPVVADDDRPRLARVEPGPAIPAPTWVGASSPRRSRAADRPPGGPRAGPAPGPGTRHGSTPRRRRHAAELRAVGRRDLVRSTSPVRPSPNLQQARLRTGRKPGTAGANHHRHRARASPHGEQDDLDRGRGEASAGLAPSVWESGALSLPWRLNSDAVWRWASGWREESPVTAPCASIKVAALSTPTRGGRVVSTINASAAAQPRSC